MRINFFFFFFFLLFIILTSTPLARSNADHQSFKYLNESLPIPLAVRVRLLGLRGDGSLLDYLPSQLVADLRGALPFLEIYSEATRQPVGARYALEWIGDLDRLPREVHSGIKTYENLLVQVSRFDRVSCSAQVPVTQELIKHFDALHGRSREHFSLFLVHPSVHRLAALACAPPAPSQPPKVFRYVYHFFGNQHPIGSAAFIGPNWIVLDLAASAPPIGQRAGPAHRLLPRPAADDDAAFGRLKSAALDRVLAAVQFVVAPHLRFAPEAVVPLSRLPPSLLIPVIVLRDTLAYNPLDALDVQALAHAARQIHGQERAPQLFYGSHSVHDHKHLAIALAKALRTDAHHQYDGSRFALAQQPYLDSRILLQELAGANDVLAHAQRMMPGAMEVRPIFVLALAALPRGAFFADHKEMPFVASDGRVSLVLASPGDPVPLPFLVGVKGIAENTTAALTKNVVAAMLMAAGGAGLAYPFRRYDPAAPDGGYYTDYSLSIGHQPFGPFANVSAAMIAQHGVSNVLLDAVRRNRVVAQLSVVVATLRRATDGVEALLRRFLNDRLGGAAQQGRTGWLEMMSHIAGMVRAETDRDVQLLSGGAIAHIHDELRKFEEQLDDVAHLLYLRGFAEADQRASSLILASSTFEAFVEDQVDILRSKLVCCQPSVAQHQDSLPRGSFLSYFSILFFVCFFVFFLFRSYFHASSRSAIQNMVSKNIQKRSN